MRLAVLASHGGSTLQALIDACADGAIDAEVALVVSNNSQAGAMARAQTAGIPTQHISAKTHGDEAGADRAIVDALQHAAVDWVLLLGYMKKMGPNILHEYQGKIINTHPALLPDFGGKGFYGRKVHEAVQASGVRESGATLHLVGSEYDSGPILAQVRVPILPEDDVDAIEQRVKQAEKGLLVDTLRRFSRDEEITA
ncbi:MAG TPA: phosphoribosylglycinamide formyltransferase [Gammaproteobacteria bacterium]|nr:phosphoribosylglycinamide formyltransferase [Gammaproteobacteria bacterium]